MSGSVDRKGQRALRYDTITTYPEDSAYDFAFMIPIARDIPVWALKHQTSRHRVIPQWTSAS